MSGATVDPISHMNCIPHSGCRTTGGGNSNIEGAECQFPFLYKGVLYTTCIDVDHHTEWCYTERPIDTEDDRAWGHCINCPTASNLGMP